MGVKRKSQLWLSKPKRRKLHFTVTPRKCVLPKPRTPSTVKYCSLQKVKTAKSSDNSPKSSKKSRKKLNLEPANDDIEDDFTLLCDEDVPQGSKDFINIATDTNVLNALSSVGLLLYFTQFFTLVKERKYPLCNIALLLWIETVFLYQCSINVVF